MQISNKIVAASIVGAGLAVTATQNADIRLTAPVPISADLMRIVLPILAAVIPILIQNLAPTLLPFWQWLKGWLPLPAELAEYQRIVAAKTLKPDCPIWHRHIREAFAAVFDKYHPAPNTSPPPAAATPEVTNAT
jgi:hypothetical protein